jgi:hypothetical protein
MAAHKQDGFGEGVLSGAHEPEEVFKAAGM